MRISRNINWGGYDVSLIVQGEHVSFRMMMRSCSFADEERIATDVLDIFEKLISNPVLQDLIDENIKVGGESTVVFKHKSGKLMMIPFIFKANEIIIKTVILKDRLIVKDRVYFGLTKGGWKKIEQAC